MRTKKIILLGFLVLALGLTPTVLWGVEGDVVFQRKGAKGGTPPAVFPHWIHRIRYKCYACHPTLFKMKAGADKVTMEMIQQGKSCGVCHNGKIAWGSSFDTCNRCHVAKK